MYSCYSYVLTHAQVGDYVTITDVVGLEQVVPGLETKSAEVLGPNTLVHRQPLSSRAGTDTQGGAGKVKRKFRVWKIDKDGVNTFQLEGEVASCCGSAVDNTGLVTVESNVSFYKSAIAWYGRVVGCGL